jgi:RNA binding motif
MTVKDTEITFKLIEGEEEEKFLEKAIAEMKERRNKFTRGKGRGGGKHNFNNRKRRGDEGNQRNHEKRAKVGAD